VNRLEGRVALVTGAQRGIGAAIAEAFAAEGATVAINFLPGADRAREAAQLATRLAGSGAGAVTAPADVADSREVDLMIERLVHDLGGVDILVANAAVGGSKPWHELLDVEWRRVLDVNLSGLFFCCRAVYPHMRTRGSGKIITASSVMAELGRTGSLHYVTSKAGIVGFTRSLAREVGSDGISVNCIMPGAIRTDGETEDFPDQDGLARQLAEVQSIKRRGLPMDVAQAAVFLASAESDFITGQVLVVDGGWANR